MLPKQITMDFLASFLPLAEPRNFPHNSLHYWRRPLCRGPRALGKGPKALGKGFAERRPRQRALRKKNLMAKRLFAEGHLSGTRQSLFRVPTTTLGKEKQPSTALLRWRRLCWVPTVRALGKDIFFFKNSLPSATPASTRQSHFLIFLKSSLPSASPAWHSAKIFCF